MHRNEELQYPRLKWPNFGTLASIISALIGVFILFAPNISILSVLLRGIIFIVATAVPAVLIILFHFIRKGITFCKRARSYDSVLHELSECQKELESAKITLINLVREFHIRNCYFIEFCYDYDGSIIIALQKKPDSSLSVGDKISVVDRESGTAMGVFNIYSVDHDSYYLWKHGCTLARKHKTTRNPTN